MKITKLIILVLILFHLFNHLVLARDGDIFKERIDISLEQKINENVRNIRETVNITKEEEMKIYKTIKETDLRIRKDDEAFNNLIREMGKKIIPICERCLKEEQDPLIRKKAAIALSGRVISKTAEYEMMHGRVDNEENRDEENAIISIAMRTLKDANADVRRYGVYILWNSLRGFKYNPETIKILKKVKREDEDIGVRNTASKALRQLGIRDAFTEEEWEDLEKHGVIID